MKKYYFPFFNTIVGKICETNHVSPIFFNSVLSHSTAISCVRHKHCPVTTEGSLDFGGRGVNVSHNFSYDCIQKRKKFFFYKTKISNWYNIITDQNRCFTTFPAILPIFCHIFTAQKLLKGIFIVFNNNIRSFCSFWHVPRLLRNQNFWKNAKARGACEAPRKKRIQKVCKYTKIWVKLPQIYRDNVFGL